MSTITSSSQSLPDFAELAEKLQSTAQALLTLDSTVVGETEDEPPSGEKAPPEIRSFRIPGFMIAKERQMLDLLKAENWQHMFDKTYEQLYTMALLMQHFEADEDIAVRLRVKKKVQNLNAMWYKEFAKNFATQGDFGHESP